MDHFGGARDAAVPAVTPDRRYDHVHDDVLPALREKGVTEEQIEQMLVGDPRRYFS